MPEYTAPSLDSVNFQLEGFTAPSLDAVDFELLSNEIELPPFKATSKISISSIEGFFNADYDIGIPALKTTSKIGISSINFAYANVICTVSSENMTKVNGFPLGEISLIINT